MKKTPKKLQISKETLRILKHEGLGKAIGGLQDSEHGEGCTWTAGGTCGEWTCLGCWTDETAC